LIEVFLVPFTLDGVLTNKATLYPTKPIIFASNYKGEENNVAKVVVLIITKEKTVLMTNRVIMHELRNPELHLSRHWRKLRIAGTS
jgi:hypothetical protein